MKEPVAATQTTFQTSAPSRPAWSPAWGGEALMCGPERR